MYMVNSCKGFLTQVGHNDDVSEAPAAYNGFHLKGPSFFGGRAQSD